MYFLNCNNFHLQMPNRYTCGNITTGTHGGHSPSTSTTKQHNPDGVKIHDDVSILYDSILTPRSSIVPEKLNRIDFSGKFLQTTPLNLICARHRQEQMQNCRHSTSDSDHADSGKGESDQDVGHNNQMGPRCNRQCLRYGQFFSIFTLLISGEISIIISCIFYKVFSSLISNV